MDSAKEKKSIKEWPEDERPREKVLRCGASALSKSELLAILIGSGSADESAVELMKKVLASCGDSIAELARMSIDELCMFKGIGPAKAITIVAACELWKRRQIDDRGDSYCVRSSSDLFAYVHPIMCDLPVEQSYVLLLNNRNNVIDDVKIATGGLTSTVVDVRLVLREALLKRATGIALCHNHPSGSMRPSGEDDRLTQTIAAACKVMNIRFLDHLIIAGDKYFSYNDESRL